MSYMRRKRLCDGGCKVCVIS